MVYIYVLKLEEGKYYVGKTNNPKKRLKEHIKKNGSQWTNMYKPMKVIEIIDNCDDFDEDKITMKYMDKYGIDNVRGGSFVAINLSESTIETLRNMHNGRNDKCFICGKVGHFANQCREYNEEESEEECEECEDVWECEYCGKEFDSQRGAEYHERVYCKNKYDENRCYRCGRRGHYEKSCFATTNVKGYYLV